MSDVETLILIATSLGAGIVMIASHVYLRMFYDLHVVVSYTFGSMVNLLALIIALQLTTQWTLLKLILYIGAIWGVTGILVYWAYTMDFAGKRMRRKALKPNIKGNGKRTD